MPKSALTFRRGLVAAVIVLMVLSLLPHRFTGYATIVRSVTVSTLSLLAQPLHAVASSLRRYEERPVLGEQEQLSQRIQSLEAEVMALRERERQLVRTVEELEGLRRRLGETYEYRVASVIGRSSDNTLQLNIGTRQGVRVGMAVVERASIVGRISQVGPTSSTLSLITAPDTLIEVVAVPATLRGPVLPEDRRGRLLLQPARANLMVALEVDAQLPVEAGDYARLLDERWPRAVQGMIVGQVIGVEDDPDDPLLKLVGVRPMTSLPDLDEVTVIVPRREEESASAEAGEGGAR